MVWNFGVVRLCACLRLSGALLALKVLGYEQSFYYPPLIFVFASVRFGRYL